MSTLEATRMSDLENRPRRSRIPIWAIFTTATVLVPIALIATGFAAAHQSEGGGEAFYVPATLLAGLAVALFVLGFRRLPRSGGVAGRWAAIILGALGLGIVAGVAGVVSGDGARSIVDQETGDIVLPFWLIAATILLGAAASVWVWRAMDEAAREAHKWAWYWGGSIGIIPGFVIAIGDGGVALAGRLGFEQPAELIEFGLLSVLSSMIVGYLLAWGLWWLRRR